MFYLDTSALLPYYRNEPASVPVQQFLSALTEPVRISSLTKVELASALARIVRMGELDEPGALLISKLFEQDLRAGLFQAAPVGESHYAQAELWLLRRDTALRTLDALHLACCHAIGGEMVTSDRSLYTAAERLKIACRLLA